MKVARSDACHPTPDLAARQICGISRRMVTHSIQRILTSNDAGTIRQVRSLLFLAAQAAAAFAFAVGGFLTVVVSHEDRFLEDFGGSETQARTRRNLHLFPGKLAHPLRESIAASRTRCLAIPIVSSPV
jgi:hypothetical protein